MLCRDIRNCDELSTVPSEKVDLLDEIDRV